MTAPAITPATEPGQGTTPRPGSRAARMALPRSVDVLKEIASEYGVCVRPISMRQTDLETGVTQIIDLPCGATREDKCAPCAKKNQRLRRTQIREGWHRTEEPLPGPEPATEAQKALVVLRAHLEFGRADAMRTAQWDQVAEIDEAIREVEEAITTEGLRGRVAPPHRKPDDEDEDQADEGKRRVRSTRRRQDAPELPRRKVEQRTVGRVYTAPDGSTHQPSMWLTLTLDSYGPVLNDGTPVYPDRYDYRRAAWDAVHFPRLLDRFWQNLRRCEGWNVQYAGCVEPQRRLAPHAHFAIRGTIPREILRTVAAATYHQVWWPSVDVQRYTAQHPPVWNGETWIDPATGTPLQSWADALDAIDSGDDTEPVHVARFGSQVDAQGVMPGTRDAERAIRYVTKYITKQAGNCHAVETERQRAHLDRLWRELRVTPCSDRCANWLLYGVQPKKAHAKLKPGRCKGKVHQRETLGIGGRRILISRDWSGKTLADHKADAREWVRALLGVTVGLDGAGSENGRGASRHAWELARQNDPDVPPLAHRLLRGISERAQWKAELLAAKDRAAQHEPPATVPADPDLSTHLQEV
jgi:hypothetical protein